MYIYKYTVFWKGANALSPYWNNVEYTSLREARRYCRRIKKMSVLKPYIVKSVAFDKFADIDTAVEAKPTENGIVKIYR